MTGMRLGVLVGYDGSRDSEETVMWAVREAEARRTTVTVCHAWQPCRAAPGDEAAAAAIARRAGEAVLARGTRFARSISDTDGAGAVTSLLVEGNAATVPSRDSAAATMVVVGSRGQGGLAEQRLGSVSAKIAAHGSGPVVVVRGHWRPAGGYVPGPIVVGADSSVASHEAVVFALAEAAVRGEPVLAVCALADAAETLGGAHEVKDRFGQSVDRWQEEYPHVDVHRQIADGSPREALLEATHAAQLVVVGARGRRGVHGMSLGSVSHALLRHARCPVAVVHPRVSARR